MSPRVLLLPMGLALGLLACGSDGSEESPEPSESADTGVLLLPDTTAPSVWQHLGTERYTETWWTWPGKGELYPGQEPHGALLTTYLNFLAHDALTNGATTLPPGAIVVKENYAPDSTLAAVTVMYKSAGYDVGHNDWFWVKFGPTGEPEVSGRVEDCVACHSQSSTDYVLTAPLGAARPIGRDR